MKKDKIIKVPDSRYLKDFNERYLDKGYFIVSIDDNYYHIRKTVLSWLFSKFNI